MSKSESKSGASRTHLTNRADSKKPSSQSGSSSFHFGNVPVIKSQDISVRCEAIKEEFPLKGDGRGNKAHRSLYKGKKMYEAVTDFREWAEDDVTAVLQSDEGDLVTAGEPHRFSSGYRKKQYARLQQLSRNIQDDYGKLLNTVMLTFTASYRSSDGGLVGYIDHLHELLSSWDSVRRELHRVLEDYEWEYIAIIEPHKSGYAHLHLAVFVRGMVQEPDFDSVINKHIENCELAGEKAHKDSISVSRYVDREEDASNLGAYLAAYMGDSLPEDADEDDGKRWTDDYDEVPAHVLRFWTTLWLSGRQQFRPSNGAQQYMQQEDDEMDESQEENRQDLEEEEEPKEWFMVGISTDGRVDSVSDDCFYFTTGPPGGQVETATLGSLNEEAKNEWCKKLSDMRH